MLTLCTAVAPALGQDQSASTGGDNPMPTAPDVSASDILGDLVGATDTLGTMGTVAGLTGAGPKVLPIGSGASAAAGYAAGGLGVVATVISALTVDTQLQTLHQIYQDDMQAYYQNLQSQSFAERNETADEIQRRIAESEAAAAAREAELRAEDNARDPATGRSTSFDYDNLDAAAQFLFGDNDDTQQQEGGTPESAAPETTTTTTPTSTTPAATTPAATPSTPTQPCTYCPTCNCSPCNC